MNARVRRILGAREILDELRAQSDARHVLTPGNADQVHEGLPYFRPMDLGGTDGSPHSRILRAMMRRGWVIRRTRGSNRSYSYAITAAGRAALIAGTV